MSDDPSDPTILNSTSIWHLADPERYRTFRDATERTSFSLSEGLPGRILESKEAHWIEDVQIDTNFPRNAVAGDIGVHSAFGFPVAVGGEVPEGEEARQHVVVFEIVEKKRGSTSSSGAPLPLESTLTSRSQVQLGAMPPSITSASKDALPSRVI